MRSLFFKILLWSVAALAVALAASFALSTILTTHSNRREGFFGRMAAMHLDDARHAYESGGRQKLGNYLERLQRCFPGDHFLTNVQGRDLLSGVDRSATLRQVRAGALCHLTDGRLAVAAVSSDGRYRFCTVITPSFTYWSFLPYHLLILGIVALFCYILAVNLATPLRTLAKKVEQFGKGDWGVRVHSRRRDEIGELARAFDRMAEQIGTMRSAERRLLQDISHELRSPLARMSFAVELAGKPESGEQAVTQLRKEIGRLTCLVDALLQVTRLESGNGVLEIRETALGELLRDVAETCAIEGDAKGCKIQLKIPPQADADLDRELIYRALENVLRNAIRHAPEQSAVDFSLEGAEAAWVIRVRDRGEGVPEEFLQAIFDPFFQVDGARTPSRGGAGLGLAIAKRAVELHGGTLEAGNRAPGLEVVLTLPKR